MWAHPVRNEHVKDTNISYLTFKTQQWFAHCFENFFTAFRINAENLNSYSTVHCWCLIISLSCCPHTHLYSVCVPDLVHAPNGQQWLHDHLPSAHQTLCEETWKDLWRGDWCCQRCWQKAWAERWVVLALLMVHYRVQNNSWPLAKQIHEELEKGLTISNFLFCTSAPRGVWEVTKLSNSLLMVQSFSSFFPWQWYGPLSHLQAILAMGEV